MPQICTRLLTKFFVSTPNLVYLLKVSANKRGAFSLSLSLSLSHTHTHIYQLRTWHRLSLSFSLTHTCLPTTRHTRTRLLTQSYVTTLIPVCQCRRTWRPLSLSLSLSLSRTHTHTHLPSHYAPHTHKIMNTILCFNQKLRLSAQGER